MMIRIILIAASMISWASVAFAQIDSLEIVPTWYKAEKPWRSISREGRLEMLNFRRAYQEQEKKAREASGIPITASAARGRQLLLKIVAKYGLDDFYRMPGTFGGRMVIWIPEREWKTLGDSDRESLIAYMRSKYSHYGIGTGRLKGSEVLFDRLVVEH